MRSTASTSAAMAARGSARSSRASAPLAVIVALLALLAGAARARPPLFETAVTLLPGAPWTVAGDFDGDGHPDVAMVGRGSVPVSHLGLGLRAFSSATLPPPASNRYQYPVLADANGDGLADIVSAVAYNTVLHWNEGHADGSFGAGSDLSLPCQGVRVAAADVNGDGRADIACLGSNPPRLVVWVSQPGGGWQGPQSFVTTEGPTGITFVDLDEDGNKDIAFGTSSGNLGWSRGLGAGAFSSPTAMPWPANEYVHGVMPANLDGDAHVDLVVPFATTNSEGVALLHGLGDGTFTRESVMGVAGNVGAGDVDQDGLTDLVAFVGPSARIRLASSGWSAAAERRAPAGRGYEPITVIDMDGDGRRDVVYSSDAGGRVLWQNADGSFGNGRHVELGADLVGLVAADFDQDGHVDVAGQVQGGVRVRRGVGLGAFAPVIEQSDPPGSPPMLGALESAELTGDGLPDLVIATSTSIPVLRSLGDGTFAAVPGGQPGVGPRSLALGDIEGDGDTDIVESTWYGSITGTNTSDLRTMVNDGSGSFTNRAPVFPTSGNGYDRVLLADLNTDGKLDLLSQRLALFVNDGSGVFQYPELLSTVPYYAQPTVKSVAEITGGDGTPDILYETPGGLAVLPGVGGGNFGVPIFTPAPEIRESWPNSDSGPVIADLDGDGRPEVAYESWTEPGAFWVLFTDGTGHFTERHLYALEDFGLGRLRVADVDGDGNLDLLTLHPQSSSVEWIRNVRVRPIQGVPTASPSALALEGATLARGGAPLRFHVRLAGGDAARLELIDVQGRVRQSLALDSRRGASQDVVLAAPGAPGVWFARVRQGGASVTRKVCAIR